MSLEEVRARIKARVWKAVAQSKLDVSAIDQATMESLIDLVADAAMAEADQQISKSVALSSAESPADDALLDDNKEDILWEGRPFLSLVLHYTVTDERIRITEGFLGKARENVELIRIQDIDYKQSLSERMLNLGDINIRSHDPSNPVIQLKNIKDPDAVYEILRRAVLAARKRHNFTYREEM